MIKSNNGVVIASNSTIKGHNNKIEGDNNRVIGHNNIIRGNGNRIEGHNNTCYGIDNVFDSGHNNVNNQVVGLQTPFGEHIDDIGQSVAPEDITRSFVIQPPDPPKEDIIGGEKFSKKEVEPISEPTWSEDDLVPELGVEEYYRSNNMPLIKKISSIFKIYRKNE